jgi:hypothetical protein
MVNSFCSGSFDAFLFGIDNLTIPKFDNFDGPLI